VGSYTVEGLVRAGIGKFVLIDDDLICLTNVNRQLIATRDTVGKAKVEVAKERILSINPNAEVEIFRCFYSAETAEQFDFTQYDYIVDGIDTITSKIELILRAQSSGTPIISCMGAGNKLDATAFEVADIYKTTVCPLARVMRKELKERGVKSLKVVYSKEQPITPIDLESSSCRNHCICPKGTQRKCTIRRQIPGSISFVPSVAGLIVAGEVIKDLIKNI